jgi:PAS domain S-box-containing protein/putative nucleotidyltransferase with HDIG domain
MATQRKVPENDIADGAALMDQLEAVMNVTEDGLVLLDVTGGIVKSNRAFLDLTGCGEEEVLGTKFESLSLFDHAGAVDVLRRLNVVLSGQSVSPFRVVGSNNGGNQFELEIRFSIWTRQGKIAGAVAVVSQPPDSSARMKVTEGEERFRDLVETTSDWVWETDEKGVYTYVSPRVAEVLGYEPHEVVGKSQFDFMPLQEAHRAVDVLTSIIESNMPFRFLHMQKMHKDGRPVFLETSGVPFLGPDGKLRGYRGVHRDVTERRKAEEKAQQTFRKLETTVESVIQAIALTVEMRDRYTAGHQERVKRLAGAIAREMQLPYERLQIIRVAALLHDLGKIFVPAEILTKSGTLSQVEFAVIKVHPQSGYDILKNIEFPWPIADVVVQHHERMNGSGYPMGLHGEEITPEARILAVADVVEAMVFHRAYRPALGTEAALKEIVKKKETLYDTKVVEACLDVFLDQGFEWD